MEFFLDIGLLGFNSALMGLALGNFFEKGTALYIVVLVLAAMVEMVNLVLAKWLPIPFLAAPFIVTFWVFWPIASHVGVHTIPLGDFPDEPVHYHPGHLFLPGVHAVLAQDHRRRAVPHRGAGRPTGATRW